MSTSKGQHPGQRRYPSELKERAVRTVLELRREDPADRGGIGRVGRQLGVGVESLRTWVKQAEIDADARPGVTMTDHHELNELQREVRELRRANDVLRAAAAFMPSPRSYRPGSSAVAFCPGQGGWRPLG